MKTIITSAFLLLFSIFLPAQSLSSEQAESFIKALVTNSAELDGFFDSTESALSSRLGITYQEIKFKQLISIDIDRKIKNGIAKNEIKYNCEIIPLEKNYSKLVVGIQGNNREYEYYFNNSKLISRPYYYSRNWNHLTSKYFVFHTNSTSLLNEYSINKLDSFVEAMLENLRCSEDEKQHLRDEKIHYFLCRNDTEINNLTGYTARGLYYIPNDYIISTFNCHYHEICHLLINYKLKSLKLYTQPLFQEGFAVAFGGRGGKEPNVILSMGSFLEQSNFVSYQSLLSRLDFQQLDASMTYPVAGLYTKFLIESIGIKSYLELYRKYSYTALEDPSVTINPGDLPSVSIWNDFLKNQTDLNPIKVSNIDFAGFPNTIKESDNVSIYANEEEFLVKLKNSVGLKPGNITIHESKLFAELLPNSMYEGEEYLITANTDEVSIYNLFTNNLIAKYVKGFSVYNKIVTQDNGYFTFTVIKEIFDEGLDNFTITK